MGEPLMELTFTKLNDNWNADPNVVDAKISIEKDELLLDFPLNTFMYQVPPNTYGRLRFKNCSKFRRGIVNDHGFYLGQCRFSKTCPEWGEFYQVTGNADILDQPDDWISVQGNGEKHFLFYFRDDNFECKAEDWLFETKNYVGNI
jgi:hypothetical protein